MDGELYATGGFNQIDGIPFGYIAKYTGPLSVEENKLFSQINIYPSPAKDKLQIQSSKINFDKIKISNILGEEIYSKKMSSTFCPT